MEIQEGFKLACKGCCMPILADGRGANCFGTITQLVEVTSQNRIINLMACRVNQNKRCRNPEAQAHQQLQPLRFPPNRLVLNILNKFDQLLKLNVSDILTTNYDYALEDSLRNNGFAFVRENKLEVL